MLKLAGAKRAQKHEANNFVFLLITKVTQVAPLHAY
jgi:hypothetical protein